DETDKPMVEIAVLAGFGSLRRFNAVFAEVYGRAPTEIRRGRRSKRARCPAVGLPAGPDHGTAATTITSAMKPEPTGSEPLTSTIGSAPLSRCSAAAPAVDCTKITSGWRAINSFASG